jgi:NAD(P)-dependent dehydrogenase (short-subunit alcohol dehydrogenase family)
VSISSYEEQRGDFSMTARLDGKTALVTGSTSGIGRAIAERLAAEGARVVVSGRDADRGAIVVDGIRSSGGEAAFIAADLSGGAEAARGLATAVTAHFGGAPEILVNNAGIYPGATTLTVDETMFDAVMTMNVKAPFFLTAALVPGMIERGSGSIINLGSWVATLAVGVGSLYASSKATVELLTKAWAAEFGKQGIRVNAVSPGVIRTEGTVAVVDMAAQMMASTPAGRVGLPEEIAAAVAFLASDDASFIHATVMPVDGGRAMTF